MSLNRKNTLAYISGLCLPVASFVYSLFHPKEKYFRIHFILFFAFVGMAFLYTGDGADVTRYVVNFEYVHSIKKIGFFEFFQTIPLKQQIDYYSVFMQWLISRFTGNPKIYLGLLASIYSIFFLANVEYIINRTNDTRLNILLIILLIVAPKLMFITHRWWTALQVFLFGALPVIFERKYKRIIWCVISSALIHFSFIYPLIILLLSLVLPKRTLWPYLLLFLVCNVLKEINFSAITPYVERLMPKMTVDRTISYINAEEHEHNFFSMSATLAMNLANVVLAIWIYYKGKQPLTENQSLGSLYVTSLLIGSFAMICSQTEWGGRYLNLSNFLFVCLYIYYFSINTESFSVNKIFRILSPVFLYVIAFHIRGFLCIIGPLQLFVGNYFTTWFIEDTSSVLNLIKHIL